MKNLVLILLLSLSQVSLAGGFSIQTIQHKNNEVIRLGISDRGFNVSVKRGDDHPAYRSDHRKHKHSYFNKTRLNQTQKAKIRQIKQEYQKKIARIDQKIERLENQKRWYKGKHKRLHRLIDQREIWQQQQRQAIRKVVSHHQWQAMKHSI